MSRNLYIIGTAGSGKTTLTHAFQNWMQSLGLDTITVNLDPGVEDLPYAPDVDVRDWIRLDEIMEQRGLGPNGAQIVAADLLALNAHEIADVLGKFETNYVLIDTPGQIELFTFRESASIVIDTFGREDSALVYLNDPALVKQPSGLVASTLLVATTQFRHNLPFINVLSKADLLTPEELEQVVKWSLDPMALYDALTQSEATPRMVLDTAFFESLERIGVYKRLTAVSSEIPFGFEDIYAQVQMVFEGGEDLRPD
jgi:GTPase SAR1 family protein